MYNRVCSHHLCKGPVRVLAKHDLRFAFWPFDVGGRHTVHGHKRNPSSVRRNRLPNLASQSRVAFSNTLSKNRI
jgi:hypothetical protein